MLKIMLVLDNLTDQEFLEKVLKLLSYDVIALSKGLNLSEELIDHFPDIVFASTLGKNEKILEALVKIKQARGKPKLVFVRQEREAAPLNEEQKKVIDGVLYSPIDPFKLIDVLSDTTSEDAAEIRKRYLDVLRSDRGAKGNKGSQSGKEPNMQVGSLGKKDKDKDYGDTHVMGVAPDKNENTVIENEKIKEREIVKDKDLKTSSFKSIKENNNDEERLLSIIGGAPPLQDPERKKKYDNICAQFEKVDKVARNIDAKTLKELQRVQSQKVTENKKIKEERKHFIKTLFTMSPLGGKKD